MDQAPDIPPHPSRLIASFRVYGVPKTKGSARAFIANMRDGRQKAVVTNDNALEKAWRRDVELQGRTHAPTYPLTGPVEVRCIFVLPRPQDPKYPTWPIGHQQGDLDKLLRSLWDALQAGKVRGVKRALRKSGFFADDKQVVHTDAWKVYGKRPGVWVEVYDLAAQGELF